MWIFMAVPTELVRDRASEIAFVVAFPARKIRMFTFQSKAREIMIEVPGGTIALPTDGIMTPLAFTAGLNDLEGSAVGPFVAALAAVERQSFKEKNPLMEIAFHSCISGLRFTGARRRCLGMAFLTWNYQMQPGEREGCTGMVKL
jgi:hypothetical protein